MKIRVLFTVLALALSGVTLSACGPVCDEDEACWDCRVMGNKVCGPGAFLPPAR